MGPPCRCAPRRQRGRPARARRQPIVKLASPDRHDEKTCGYPSKPLKESPLDDRPARNVASCNLAPGRCPPDAPLFRRPTWRACLAHPRTTPPTPAHASVSQIEHEQSGIANASLPRPSAAGSGAAQAPPADRDRRGRARRDRGRAAVVASVEEERGAGQRPAGRPGRRTPPRRPGRLRQPAAAGAGGHRLARRDADRAVRARHGHAAGHRDGEDAAVRLPAVGQLHRRPDGQEGRRARADRPAPVPGRARERRRHARPRPGAAGHRAPRPQALPDAARAGLDRGPAGRHAGLAGQAVRRHREDRPGLDRLGQAEPDLRAHHRAGLGPRRPAPGGRRQLRDAGRHQRHRGDHAAAADQRDLHHLGGQPAADPEAGQCAASRCR